MQVKVLDWPVQAVDLILESKAEERKGFRLGPDHVTSKELYKSPID
jgi:hypothetical protein